MCALFKETFQQVGAENAGDEHEPIEKDEEQETKDGLDELALDDSKAYKIKISRYIKRSLQCVSDYRFWFCMHATRQARAPLMHFYRILSSAAFTARMRITELVAYRIQTIEREFGGLVDTFQHWFTNAMNFGFQVEGDPHHTRPDGGYQLVDDNVTKRLMDFASALLLHNAGAFNRRVVRTFSRSLEQKQTSCALGRLIYPYHSGHTGHTGANYSSDMLLRSE